MNLKLTVIFPAWFVYARFTGRHLPRAENSRLETGIVVLMTCPRFSALFLLV